MYFSAKISNRGYQGGSTPRCDAWAQAPSISPPGLYSIPQQKEKKWRTL